MPRAESTKHMGSTQFYHSQFTNSHYLADSSSASPPLSPASQQSPQSGPASASATGAGGPNTKKKHICGTCDRAFTTSGHLARHSRVHTGERNHKCPFPGCETRCSRQDNLQQHYRIHLSPGSRRSSNRSNKGAAKKGAAAAAAPATSPLSSVEPSSTTPPLPSTPALEPARIYTHHSTPPDATPPLAQATLPATATLPLTTASHNRMDAGSDRSSNGGSPHLSYSAAPHHHMAPMSSQQQQQQQQQHFSSGGNGAPTQQYSYRNGTTTYQEQSQSQGANPAFTYVHTTPISTAAAAAAAASGSSGSAGGAYPSYSTAQDGYAMQQQQQQQQNRSPPHHSMSSRHSISHISHPQTYSQQQQQQQHHHHHQSASAGPASPASSHSVSSHTSGPPTPPYPVYDDGTHPASYSNANSTMIADHAGGYATQSQTAHIISNGYSQPAPTTNGRFGSPPPVLAPIQDERLVRRDDSRHSHSHTQQQPQQHNASPYIHHPHPLPTEYSYHSSLGLGHGAWKGESAIRKNVGTALV